MVDTLLSDTIPDKDQKRTIDDPENIIGQAKNKIRKFARKGLHLHQIDMLLKRHPDASSEIVSEVLRLTKEADPRVAKQQFTNFQQYTHTAIERAKHPVITAIFSSLQRLVSPHPKG